MAFARPDCSRQHVNAAGKLLRTANSVDNFNEWASSNFMEYVSALDVINNWRSAHGYPLNSFTTTLRICAKRFDESPLIAQRTKRLASIVTKLVKRPSMKLTQMQDIGGCRAVLPTVSQVRQLQKYYEEEIDFSHEGPTKDDYITSPKSDSGYRSVHLIYRYKSDRPSTAPFNDLKIEIQLRSLYQHAWATSVETVGTFVRQALKSSQGENDWLQFFKLMGTVIAFRERCPLVPGTPSSRIELREMLQHYAQRLRVEQRLRSYSVAVNQVRQTAKANTADRYFLLQLDPSNEVLTITGFPKSALDLAQQKYAEAEKQSRDQPNMDSVLVSVDSLSALERAYPNYFADTRMFTQLMTQELSGRTRGVSVPPLRAGKNAQLSFLK